MHTVRKTERETEKQTHRQRQRQGDKPTRQAHSKAGGERERGQTDRLAGRSH